LIDSEPANILLSGDGRRALRFFVYGPAGYRNEIRDVATGEIVGLLPLEVNGPCTGCFRAVVTDYTGDRLVFIRDGDGVSLWERGVGIRRITALPQPGRQGPFEAALSRDGMMVAFYSDSDFDPSVTTGGRSQVFVYDTRTDVLRQLTGRESEGGGYQPRLSADGTRLSYRPESSASEIWVVDTASGSVLHHIDVGTEDEIGDYLFSDDGNVLAFMTTADLDPDVGNPERWSQLFRADLAVGLIEQVTDVRGDGLSGWFLSMDGSANTFYLALGGVMEIDDVSIFLGGTRFVRRREPNVAPTLEAPSSVSGSAGSVVRFVVSAADSDRDPLIFSVGLESVLTFGLEAWQLGVGIEDVLDSDGDGQTAITVRPGFGHVGHHRLQVAVFDGVGGAAARVVDLYVADAGPPEIDINCDHRFDAEDLLIVAAGIFGPIDGRISHCMPIDTDGDGTTNAADLTTLLRMFGPRTASLAAARADDASNDAGG